MQQLFRITIALLLAIVSVTANAYTQSMGGMGAQLILDTAKDGSTLPRIKSLLPGSPAAAQNVPEGSFIIGVNDIPCRNKKLEDVVNIIRGDVGTTLKLSLADNAQGKKAKSYTIVRAAIQAATPATPPADPVDAFIAECEQEVKRIRRQKFSIIKTFSSDCGNYFFSFDAESAPYHIRVLTLQAAGSGESETTAGVYDNANEANIVPLKPARTYPLGNMFIATHEGEITLRASSVGVVSTKVQPKSGAGSCRSMYVIVYK